MFNNKKDNESEYERMEPAAPGNSDVRKRKTSVIGPTLIFRGELSANEDLIIEGEIEGTIAHQEKNLTVGKEGRVKANIDARTVEVYGLVEGDIHGEDVVKLAKSANVKGNIICSRLIMEDGAQFSGSIDMSQSKKIAAVPNSAQIAETHTKPGNGSGKKTDKHLDSAG
jgi:cytoskeletal protein CcmA (bactofilin family)